MLSVRIRNGFTLVEVMVGLAILAFLLALGVPSLSTFLQSAKLSSTAKSYYTGIQAARTEAIRRNLPVEFVLTNTALSTANIENVATAAPSGQNWLVRVMDPVATTYRLIEAKSGTEGSGSSGATSVQIIPTPGTFTGILSFNGFGGTSDGNAYALDVENPSGGACAAAATPGPMLCQRITVSAGGKVHLCDPAATTGDSRAC